MLDNLSKEQEAKFQQYVDKFIRLGLSTDPFTESSKNEIKDIISRCYKNGGLKPPKEFVFVDSPLACINEYMSYNKSLRAVSKVLYQVMPQVLSQVRSQVWSQVESQADSQVWSQVRSQVESQVWSQAGSQADNFAYGSQDASWLALCSYFINETDIKGLEIVQPLIDLCGKCSFWLPYEEVVFISQNPSEIHMINGKLHNTNGMSVRYADGFGCYSLNGKAMSKDVIEKIEHNDRFNSKLDELIEKEGD